MFELDFTEKIQWEKDHIKKMTPYVNKLIIYLEKIGISFEREEHNVILTKGDDTLRIANHCFYRFSGLCISLKSVKKGKNIVEEFVEVTEDMYINIYQKSIIEQHFNRYEN